MAKLTAKNVKFTRSVGTTSLSNLQGPQFVFSLAGTQQSKLIASDQQWQDNMGQNIELSQDGNTLISGVPSEDGAGDVYTSSGAVYIYTRSGTTWTEQQQLRSPIIASQNQFGCSVSLSADGNIAVIGERQATNSVLYQGVVHVYTRSGSVWTHQQMLTDPSPTSVDFFGWSVDISGDGLTIVVGVGNEDAGASETGGAQVYVNSGGTWTHQAQLTANDAAYQDYAGKSVSISNDGNTVVMGAYQSDNGQIDSGAAYIFARSGTVWSQEAEILPSTIGYQYEFGASVSMSGDGQTVLISASGENISSLSNAGAAYVFSRSGSTWTEQGKLLPSTSASSVRFGYDTAISDDGNIAVVGISSSLLSSSKVHIYSRTGGTWSLEYELLTDDAQNGDYIAQGVAISGDGTTVAAGAPQEDGLATGTGAVYIFV